MPTQDYKRMESAPRDGTTVLVLSGSRKARTAYFDGKKWLYFHSDDPCDPQYWTDEPAEAPSDYLPIAKKAEDLLDFAIEVAQDKDQVVLPTWSRGKSDLGASDLPMLQSMADNIHANTGALKTMLGQKEDTIKPIQDPGPPTPAPTPAPQLKVGAMSPSTKK